MCSSDLGDDRRCLHGVSEGVLSLKEELRLGGVGAVNGAGQGGQGLARGPDDGLGQREADVTGERLQEQFALITTFLPCTFSYRL